jgi:autotransporter-associated beta strand protein
VGASVTFNGQATANNPAQTGNRSVTLDGQQTVGSIVFNADLSTFTNQIVTGTGTAPALTFDNGGSGTTITTMGSGTGNNEIEAGFRIQDTLTAIVNQQNVSSQAGSLNLTANISGTGGFTKLGDGLATFGTRAKTYTGPTVLGGGRMRISTAAQPSATSSFTINPGGQLTLISNNGTYTFGSGPLNLNGAGPTTGQFAPFPGAIRNNTDLIATITNNVDLQSTASIHVQGSATGSTTLSGNVGGIGGLIAGANPHDANLGQLVLSGSNSYSGGSTARAGNLVAAASSVNAFGTGNLTVESANLIFGGSVAKVTISAGATNAINNLATLSLAGGNVANVADDGYIDLASGVNETVGGLILGGVTQTLPGTYGSVASGAQHPFDEFFSGLGVVNLEPAAGQPGDHNGDGKVDAADYVAWRKTDGGNQAGYNAFYENFGEGTPGGGGSGVVPEPSSLVLALHAALGLAGRRANHGVYS